MTEYKNLLDDFRKIFSQQNWNAPDIVKIPNTENILPPYLPYIGKEYKKQEGLLFVSINQNLAGVDCKTKYLDKLKQKGSFEDNLWDRLNFISRSKGDGFSGLGIGPFDDGHGIITCAIANDILDNEKLSEPDCAVWDSIAATNFVKFSFENGKRDVPPTRQAWESCYDYFIAELEYLRPKIIITMGAATESHIINCIKTKGKDDHNYHLLKIPHSSPKYLSRRIEPHHRNLKEDFILNTPEKVKSVIQRHIIAFERQVVMKENNVGKTKECTWGDVCLDLLEKDIHRKYFSVCWRIIEDKIKNS